MMDISDARKVIENLQTRPFMCSENTMELDNGYMIMKKEYFKKLERKASELSEQKKYVAKRFIEE